MYSKVVYPDYEYKNVDWENPEHECKDRMGIVEETRAFGQPLLSLVSKMSQNRILWDKYRLSHMPQCPYTRRYLHHACNQVCELIWYDSCHKH